MTQTACYLYAVTRAVDPASLGGQVALGRTPLRILEEDRLQAVVSDVPLDEYGEPALREHLEDLAWVERVARGHDEVVRLVASLGTVVPLRLVTIFTDDASVRSAVATWRGQIEEALDRVAGRREWSVKGFLRSPAPTVGPNVEGATTPAGAADNEPAAAGHGSGTAYLARKRAAVADRQRADLEASELAEAVHVGLAGHAVATRLLKGQDPQLTGRSERMILNGAYLVDAEAEDDFLGGVQALRERYPTVDLEVAGPWAPYSFATLENSHDR